ncbi:Uncharacterised protein [Mycoplasmoides gallisepticum]|uniref:Uncharacterized protein n=1 Tax=Mycoplasmoides gallisepticum TaxID=2096 RepID=A0A3B0PJX7_MYCGL|nr:Uncharacterised protein [Mycoplasmoides gallisepticum]
MSTIKFQVISLALSVSLVEIQDHQKFQNIYQNTQFEIKDDQITLFLIECKKMLTLQILDTTLITFYELSKLKVSMVEKPELI